MGTYISVVTTSWVVPGAGALEAGEDAAAVEKVGTIGTVGDELAGTTVESERRTVVRLEEAAATELGEGTAVTEIEGRTVTELKGMVVFEVGMGAEVGLDASGAAVELADGAIHFVQMVCMLVTRMVEIL